MLCKLQSPECFSSSMSHVCPSEVTTFESVNWITQFSATQFALAKVNLTVKMQVLTNGVFTSTYVLTICLEAHYYINPEQIVPFPKSKKVTNPSGERDAFI